MAKMFETWIRLAEKVTPLRIRGKERIVYGIPLGVNLSARPGSGMRQDSQPAQSEERPVTIRPLGLAQSNTAKSGLTTIAGLMV